VNDYNKPDIINNFMINAIPQSLQIFRFDVEALRKKETKKYLKVLSSISNRICDEIFIQDFYLTCSEFIDIIANYKHCNYIRIEYCWIDTQSSFSFGDKLNGAKFKTLNFGYSGRGYRSNWKANPDKLRNIIKALSVVPDIKSNLEEIIINTCGISKAEVEQMLKDENLSNIKIIYLVNQ